MAHLTVTSSDSQDFTGKVLSLDGDEVTIGRSPECTILVPDAAVSRRHAKIVRTPEGLLLVDDGGRNGLFVNGERVTHKLLANGDVVRVGHTEMCLEGGGEAAVAQPLRAKPKPVSPPRAERAERLEQTTMLEVALLSPAPSPRAAPAATGGGSEGAERDSTQCPSCGMTLPDGADDCERCGAGAQHASPAPRVRQASVSLLRATLAITLWLAGVLLVTGVLLAREKGFLGIGSGSTQPVGTDPSWAP